MERATITIYNQCKMVEGGVVLELPQAALAIHGRNITPFTYTGSENIDIPDNQISLTCVYDKIETDGVDNEFSTLVLNAYAKTRIQANCFDKNQVFEDIASNYYHKVTVDSLLPSQSINFSSENINITNKQISSNSPLKVNCGIVMNPRSGGICFEIYSGTARAFLLQGTVDGGQPLFTLNSLDRST